MEFQKILSILNPIVIWGAAASILLLDFKALLTSKILKKIAIGLVIYLVAVAFAKTAIQWHVWSIDPVSKHLLPPENPSYFYFYAFGRFFIYVIFTAISAFIFGGALKLIQYHTKSLLLSGEEVWLAVIASLLVGWPGVILLIGFTFALMLVMSIFRVRRIPLAPFIYGVLVLLLLFGPQLIKLFQLKVLKA